MTTAGENQQALLQKIARQAMLERGLLPDFPPAVLSELVKIPGPAQASGGPVTDQRELAWCSIDNDDSRDLDQLSVAVIKPGEPVRILVAIADVDSVVRKDSEIDIHARHNATSVYTAAKIFPMLPERISTDLTSLGYDADRLAIVVDMTFAENGQLLNAVIYRATVRNKAKLAYNSVGDWLEGAGTMPGPIGAVSGLAENIRIQYEIARKIRTLRFVNGALNFDTVRARPVFSGDETKGLEAEQGLSAKNLIEDFMIAANGVTARFLASKNFPSIRRVVRTPERWDRIVSLVSEWGYKLPEEPDSKALDQFLITARDADPVRFPDLSLSIIKLLGSGEYIVEVPGTPPVGHFGLAVKDYAHSTAPNRRYPDLLTQRLIKAALTGAEVPYSVAELAELSTHCTKAEDDAKKVERQVGKSASIILMQSRIGEEFEGIVTGSTKKGTWVRIFRPPVEGKLVNPGQGTDVGDRLKVKLVHTDLERGFIDFKL
jgi:VacB/RNase II family 3'-5' exoribonuclease